MYSHETQKRVRYGETDQMGYLYYGRYADLYEIGRVEMLRSLGLTYREMEEVEGIMLPVKSLQMRFVRPAKYDELLTIKTSLREMPDKDIVFYVEVFNEKNKIVNGGSVRLAFVEMATNKTVTAPAFLVEKLKPYF
ncbi:MAG: thioesterase family protein [Saprospiraceae bacterium]|jgi:acyl-CoA thioester hydrolase